MAKSEAVSDQNDQQRNDGPTDPAGAELPFALDLEALNLSSDVAALPDDIDELRVEVDRMDAVILAAIQRRSAVSKKIGAHRMATGGPRLVHSREMKVLDRFSALGTEGHTLAMLLLRLGRGPLGR
ncbi:MAG: chorismate mutase [Gordonia sp.]|nr:chorismate mutase [Gordonia sp. (in: high G+C Gram-positive bacteria)]